VELIADEVAATEQVRPASVEPERYFNDRWCHAHNAAGVRCSRKQHEDAHHLGLNGDRWTEEQGWTDPAPDDHCRGVADAARRLIEQIKKSNSIFTLHGDLAEPFNALVAAVEAHGEGDGAPKQRPAVIPPGPQVEYVHEADVSSARNERG
jgi:hypothetical protein